MSNLLERPFDPQDEALAMRQYLDLVRSGQLRWEELTTVPTWKVARDSRPHIWSVAPWRGREIAFELKRTMRVSQYSRYGFGLTACLVEVHARHQEISTPDRLFRDTLVPQFNWLGSLSDVRCDFCKETEAFESLQKNQPWTDNTRIGLPHLVERYGPAPLLVGKESKEAPQ